MEADKSGARVVTEEASRFIADCLHAAGANQEAAEQQAKLLIEAEKLGHPSHGMNRLDFYINDIISGACEPNNKPEILKETASTAWIDAKNVLGATSSHFAMDIAMTKARQTGVAWVVVKGANHFGIAGYWAQIAADEGLIGLSFCNTSPVCAPTRSKEAALGTNPFACVAPGSSGESFYLDMATTAVALGKIEMQIRKGEPIPSGWAQGPDGNETQDAQLAFDTKCLYPLGGSELTSGYKGYGLGAMVELFCGILGGSKYGHYIRAWSHASDGTPADLGHCFVAIDPNCFAPGFGDRLTDLVQHWRNLEPHEATMCIRVRIAEARRFIVDCLKAAGANETPAMQQAELFVQADRTGHQSHGLNRLEKCVNDITDKVCEPNNVPEIIKESRSTAWVDARNCLGATSSQLGVDLAVTKAKDTGIGWVSVKGSNYNGMLGYWAKLAAKKGFIGLAFANSPPIVAPTRSKKAALGTNPLAVVAPAGDDELFFLEMATSAVTLGAIEMRRKANISIPSGWALGLDGNTTIDPEEAMISSVLMPLGGDEITSGYKGYGLGAAVELLTGMCAGSSYAHHIQPWGKFTAENPANLGQTFVCLNPDCFAPGFHNRLLDCMQYWRQLDPVDPDKPVMAPGDIEKKAAEATDDRNAILYLPRQISICAALAEKLNVNHIETVVDKE